MSIKRLPSPDGAVPVPPCFVSTATRVTALRFELVDRILSLPVSTLKAWESLGGAEEKILIHAANGRVTILGRDLDAIHDALDNGRLQMVRESPGASAALSDGPRVHAIRIELK